MKFLPERLKGLIPTGKGKDIAEAAGISPGSLSQYATGARKPMAEELASVARVLGVPINYFFEAGQATTEALREGEDLNSAVELWKRRAKRAEEELTDLRNGLRELLQKPSSRKSPGQIVGAAVEESVKKETKLK